MARKKTKRSVGAETAMPYTHRPAEERKSGPFEEYEVRNALENLSRAIKIRKNPALMRAVRAEARRQLTAAESTKKALSGE